MKLVSVTALVSQLPMSWLNDEAKTNIPLMSVTLLTSQLPMSPLNASASSKSALISVTPLVQANSSAAGSVLRRLSRPARSTFV